MDGSEKALPRCQRVSFTSPSAPSSVKNTKFLSDKYEVNAKGATAAKHAVLFSSAWETEPLAWNVIHIVNQDIGMR